MISVSFGLGLMLGGREMYGCNGMSVSGGVNSFRKGLWVVVISGVLGYMRFVGIDRILGLGRVREVIWESMWLEWR